MDEQRNVLPWRYLADHWAAAVATCYLLGFVVVNTRASLYEVADYDLFEARYIGAGLLFLVLSSIPWAAAAGFLHWAVRADRNGRKRGIVQRSAGYAAALVGGAVVWSGPVALLSGEPLFIPWNNAAYAWLPLLFYTVSFNLALVSLGIIGTLAKHVHRLPTGESAFIFTMMAAWTVPILLAMQFSLNVYPALHPGVSGGAIWMARVPDALAFTLGAGSGTPARDVAVIDRSDNSLRVAVCFRAPNGRARMEVLEVLRERVPLFVVREIRTLEDFAGQCSAGRLHPAVATPRRTRLVG